LDCSESPLDRRLCSGHAMAGAKAQIFVWTSTARLKSGPDTKHKRGKVSHLLLPIQPVFTGDSAVPAGLHRVFKLYPGPRPGLSPWDEALEIEELDDFRINLSQTAKLLI
jgi:hypothetical protein